MGVSVKARRKVCDIRDLCHPDAPPIAEADPAKGENGSLRSLNNQGVDLLYAMSNEQNISSVVFRTQRTTQNYVVPRNARSLKQVTVPFRLEFTARVVEYSASPWDETLRGKKLSRGRSTRTTYGESCLTWTPAFSLSLVTAASGTLR